MLSSFIGQIDWPSAAVLVVIFGGLGIASVVAIGTRNTKTEEDYKLAEMEQQNKFASTTYDLETRRTTEFKKIEQGLITSHREH